MISKFNVGLKSFLHQGLSEPEFYGDFVYKFKKIMGRTDFSDQFRRIIICHKHIGYVQLCCLADQGSPFVTQHIC